MPYLVPHRFLRVHSKAAEHRQDLMGTVVHRVEIMCSSEAQDTRNPGWCKWVLSGPAEGRGEDPVSSLKAQMDRERILEYTEATSSPSYQTSLSRQEPRSKNINLSISTLRKEFMLGKGGAHL